MYKYLSEMNFTPKTVLDIGAWNGFWTKQCKKIWPDAEFTCIEAGPKYEKNLKQVTSNYHIAVLGNENKQAKIYLRKIQKGDRHKVTYTKGSSIFNNIAKDWEMREMKTLDQLVGKDAQFDIIKQDVQGAEILVMQGASEIFKRAKYVIQEVNIEKDDDFPDIPYEKLMDEYMESLGFNKNKQIDKHPGQLQIDKIYWTG